MTYAYLGSADLSDMVEMEMGRVVVICSQSTEILYIKTWDFFFIMSKFCAVLCDEVHCEYWNYQIWFYSDMNSFFWFNICSDKIVHELLQKPSKEMCCGAVRAFGAHPPLPCAERVKEPLSFWQKLLLGFST